MRRWFRIHSLAVMVLMLLVMGGLALGHGLVGGARTTEAGATPLMPAAAAPASVAQLDPGPTDLYPVVPREPLTVWGNAPIPRSAVVAPAVGADAALVMDEASASVLYEKDAHARIAPASLTKVMTALIALERGNPDDLVTVDVDSRRMRGSTVMGLVPGEQLTLDDLLYGLMLPSGNDAALAIAEHVSGSVDAFVALMNQRATELGLADTHFANPHGLDAPTHYSSAYDLALLARVAMQRDDFRRIVNTRYREVHGALLTYELGNINPLYGRVAGADGVKTGFTRAARQTIVGSVVRDGHRVYVVLLRSGDRTSDAIALINWTFAAFAWPAPQASAPVDAVAAGT